MSTLSSANVTDVNLVLKERTHMRLCLNMLIFTHNLGNWLMGDNAVGSLMYLILEACTIKTFATFCDISGVPRFLSKVLLFIALFVLVAVNGGFGTFCCGAPMW